MLFLSSCQQRVVPFSRSVQYPDLARPLMFPCLVALARWVGTSTVQVYTDRIRRLRDAKRIASHRLRQRRQKAVGNSGFMPA